MEGQEFQSLLGNDIVDLKEAGVKRKHEDARFVERVFTEDERKVILAARDPSAVLWAAWAAKEAAFKITRREDTDTVFAHQRFVVEPKTLEHLASLTSGQDTIDSEMNFQGRFHSGGRLEAYGEPIDVRWFLSHEFIHCVASVPMPPETFHHVRLVTQVASQLELHSNTSDFEPMELESINSEESIKVRVLAKQVLARELGVEGVRIVRHPLEGGRFGPPEAHIKTHTGWMIPSSGLLQLSLSHDGRYVAVAALVPSGMKAQLEGVRRRPRQSSCS